jgi:ubiquinone/menaquinone biosynthesis C-methylase UbiE
MTVEKDPERAERRHLDPGAEFAGRRVLEIGCGDGRLTWQYARHPRRVIGIDTDPAGLRYATIDRPSDLEGKVAFVRASAHDLPFPHETFDRALLAWSL